MTEPTLPGDDQVGETRTWSLPGQLESAVNTWDRREVPGGVLTVQGTLLGCGDSRAASRSRWIEVRIFLNEDGVGYAVYTAAMSSLPDEVTLGRVERVSTADAVIERLLKRRRGKETYLPMPSRRAIEQATLEDDDLRDAWAEHRAAYLAAS